MDRREKLNLRKKIQDALVELKREDLPRREKLDMRTQAIADLKRLGESGNPAQPAQPTPMFDRLVEGKFDVDEFENIVKEAIDELMASGLEEGEAVEKMKPPMKAYMVAKLKELEIRESAVGEEIISEETTEEASGEDGSGKDEKTPETDPDQLSFS